MTAYRGIDKREVMRSIAEGMAWLKKLELGPVSNEILGEFKLVELLEALEKAGSDSAVAGIMRGSGIGRLLHRFHDVFSYEPEVYGQDREKASLFRRLTAWGAFSPANSTGSQPNELDEEERRYRIRTALAHLVKKGITPGSPEEGRLEIALAELAETDESTKIIAGRLETLVPILLLLHEVGQNDEIRSVMAQNIPELPALLDTLHAVMAVKAPAGVSTADQPIMPYAIPMTGEISDYSGRAYDDILAMLAPLKQKLRAVLEPFKDTDEVTRISTGTIGGLNKFGVFFYATRRVAQAVADALNDAEVIDFNGRQIRPRPLQGPAGGSLALGL